MQQDKQQRACRKSTGLLGGKQGVNSLIAEKLWAKGGYAGFAATQKATEWFELSPAERACLQACRGQVPNGIAITSFLKASFPVFKLSLVFIAEFSRRNKHRHQASHGATTHTCPWALWLLFKSDWGGGGKCQSFSELCCKCTYGWISHLLSWLTTWVFLDVLWTYIVGSIVSRPVLRHDSAVAGFANVGSVPLVVAGGPCVPQV